MCGPAADALSDADKSALSKFEIHRVMVPAFRALVLTLQEEIEKHDAKAASQPVVPPEQELRLLRLEVARLRLENSRLAGRGADKIKGEGNPPDGDGFDYTALNFQRDDFLPKLVGEVTNKSGKDYTSAIFKVTLYDVNKQLLGTVDVIVPNLKKGQTKTFDGFLQSIDSAKIKSYKIQFQTGF